MTKKLVIVWLTLIMVLFSSISIYADEDVQGDFFEKHVIINGEEITNYNLQYPFILYNDTTYFPLSKEMGEILGVSAEMDWESRTLKLLKTDSTRDNISSNWMKNNNQDLTLNVVSGAKVLAFTYENSADTAKNKNNADTNSDAPRMATVEDMKYAMDEAEMTKAIMAANKDIIEAPKLEVSEVDLDGLPVLASGSYIFMPLRAMTSEEHFNWDIYFSPYYGICVSTDPEIPASSYADQAEILLNKGLVKYIKDNNASVTTPVAQQYLFLFKRAGDVYSIDYKLLMAMSQRESHFGIWATSRSGACGMMQIMPKTALRYGLTKEQLYNAKINIDFGAMYISERINAYEGDWVKGLSAYNQGSSRVNRGAYSTAYAEKVIAAYDALNNYLAANGYVMQ